MEANLDTILSRLNARRVRVLLAGMRAPRNLGREYAEEFDGVFARLAQKHGVVLYPFFLEGVATDPAFNQGDGIHPNAAGVDVIVRAHPALREAADRRRLTRNTKGRAQMKTAAPAGAAVAVLAIRLSSAGRGRNDRHRRRHRRHRPGRAARGRNHRRRHHRRRQRCARAPR